MIMLEAAAIMLVIFVCGLVIGHARGVPIDCEDCVVSQTRIRRK